MLEALKEKVCEANLMLPKYGLVTFTWGNVSEMDKESGLVVIKPSGVPYETMKPSDMVVVDLDGKVVVGDLNPSSDTPTHVKMYSIHPDMCAIVHTHSSYATSFAQAGRAIPAYGTTHADYFYGEVPCTRALTKEETESDYEANTGKVINETLEGMDLTGVKAILVRNHGIFTWGENAAKAAENAKVLEEIARMAFLTEMLNGDVSSAPQYLLDKHYFRKHGKNAYYGQINKEKKK